MTPETFDWIRAVLLASLGRKVDDSVVMTRPFDDGSQGFVLYVRQPAP
jgi:hypothetical protein